MKKLTYILFTCMLSTTMIAQTTVIWDGEDQTENSRGGCWDDCTPEVVNNPDKESINTSDKCLKFTMTNNNNKTMKMPFKNWISPSLVGRQRLTMMVKKSGNCNIHIELTDESSSWQHVATWYSGNNSWQKLVFDFSGNGAIEHPKVLAISQTDNVDGSTEVYIDNVAIEEPYVNGTPINNISFASLSGHLTLTGAWAKGSCSNINNMSNWQSVSYDDFDLLASKLTANVTSVDMRGASTIGAYNVFAAANPNIIIYANERFANNNLEDAFNTENYIATPEYGGMPTFFTPPTGYVGDPMPYYDNHALEFKIAYLQDFRPNPASFHPFYMVTSENLSSYSYKGEIIPCGDVNTQEQSLGTGSIFYDETKGKYYAFYTGHQGNFQSLNLNQEELFKATSDDGIHWTKQGYVLKAPSGYDPHQFRDPHIFKEDGIYHMIVTCMKRIDNRNYPAIGHFTATDIDAINTSNDVNAQHGGWTELEPLLVDMDRADNYDLYECPDMFHIGDRWYLVYSDQYKHQVKYKYREHLYNTPGDNWQDAGNEGLLLDGYDFSYYAGKTAFDGVDRYIFGWCSTTEGKSNVSNMDWAGSLIVHKLYREDANSGKLAVTVPHTFDAKFSTRTGLPLIRQEGTVSKNGKVYTLNGARLHFSRLKRANKINISFTPKTANAVFGFSLRENSSNDDPRFSFRLNTATNQLYFNKDFKTGSTYSGTQEISAVDLPAPVDGKYNLRIYQEQSICVVYVNDQVALTSRIYNISRNPWSIFCESGTVEVEEPNTWSY